MRNIEKDAIEMAERREIMLRTGFKIFSERSIEPVTMQEIANECGIGIATLYRYFKTKLSFVIAIASRQWVEYNVEVERMYAERGGNSLNGRDEFEFLLDCFIDLYKNHKNLLVFNLNFTAYVKHENADAAQMQLYNDTIKVFADKFYSV